MKILKTMRSADLYKARSTIVTKFKKRNEGIIRTFKAGIHTGFEERKARAKRLGEEAGTKLLLPMFLMLVVVSIIVIVPAF